VHLGYSCFQFAKLNKLFKLCKVINAVATAKSVLVIGSLQNFKGTIYNLLLNGFRIFYGNTIPKAISKEIIEEISLIILDAQVSQAFEIEAHSVPLIIVSGNGFGDVLDAYFLKRSHIPPVEAAEVQNEMDCLFFGGNGPQSMPRRRLELKELDGFTIVQLNGNHRFALNDGIGRALDFMEEHYFEDISLRDIARAACLSRYHFCRLFKRQVGITCISYLSQLRIERAKSLLGNTSHPITQICFDVGFNDLSHFERVFRSIAGITPSTYRKRNHLKRQEIQG